MDGSPPAAKAPGGPSDPGSDSADRDCRAYRLVLLAPLLWPEVVDWAPPRNRVAPDYWHRELMREVTTLFQPEVPGWTLRNKIALASSALPADAEALADRAADHGLSIDCLRAWQQAFQTLGQYCETGGLNLGALQEQLSGLKAAES